MLNIPLEKLTCKGRSSADQERADAGEKTTGNFHRAGFWFELVK